MEKKLVKLYNESNEAAEFLCHSILGRGQFSTAYLATRRSDGLDVILKKLAPRHPSATDSVRFRDAYNLQVELLNKTDNTAAPVIGFFHDENNVPCIALQKMTGDTLRKTTFLNVQDLFHIFCGVAKGLGQFHSAGYLMLDLNPNNLFVLSNSGSMEGCYFFDFDAFVSKENLTDLKWIHSTRGFLAPEIKAFSKATELSETADIYALGASLYYCLTGAVPNSYTYIDYNEVDIREQYKIDCTQKIKEKLNAFFYQTLNPLPTERFADWNAVYIALEELSNLAGPKNRVRLHSNIILDVGEYYIPTPAQLQQLSDFFVPRLGQKAYAVIYGNVSGCGKTTLAKAFAKTAGKHYDSIQFCNYDPKSSWDGIFSQVNAVNCPMDAKDHNEQALNALRSGHQRTLIIVDNFDEENCDKPILDWGEETHILFTSRYMADGLKALSPCERVDMDCSPELSHKIFTTVYSGLSGKTLTDKQKEIAFELLRDVEHHSYASDLIARELAQHYPTEEGFAIFAENTHTLWQSEIASRKDKNIGEATIRKTYQEHIELLFSDFLLQFKDPIEKELLYLFSLERLWKKESLYLFAGDEQTLGRFRAQDAISKLRNRNFVLETGDVVCVHPLIWKLLKAQQDSCDCNIYIATILSNIFSSSKEPIEFDFTALYAPVEFKIQAELFLKETFRQFLASQDKNQQRIAYNYFEAVALVYFAIKKPIFIASLSQKELQRLICNSKPRLFVKLRLTSEESYILYRKPTEKDGFVYFLHFLQANKYYPIARICHRYPDEVTHWEIQPNEISAASNPLTLRSFYSTKRNIIIPNRVLGTPIRNIQKSCYGSNAKHIKVSPGISEISDWAFFGQDVVSISLPDTVVSIGDAAFSLCENLKTVSLPHTLAKLGSSAFQSCTSLQEIKIPSNTALQKIEAMTFAGCSSLRSFVFPPNIKFVDHVAFAECSTLETITILNKELNVATDAFYECVKLRKVYAPKEWKAANRELLKSLPAYEPDENDPPEE